MRPVLLVLLTLIGCSWPSKGSQAAAEAPSASYTAHPRLWFRASDLPRLRSWAKDSNPTWVALAAVGDEARTDMDQKKVPIGPSCTDESGSQPCEAYAELFAFLSQVAPSEKERKDYGERAVKLLMIMMDRAVKGPKGDDELRGDGFPTDDRSRWTGEGFGLTVDWAYPYLSSDQKKTIRKVFLRWADLLTHAKVTDNNHPEPIGVVDDPKLTADKKKIRWAFNNYYTAHTRNLALMALALDKADDPDGKLRAYLKQVTGAWLYVIDALLRGDARGGMPPDGLEYGPQTLAYVTQTLLALHTAGADDLKTFGRQARLDANPYWHDLVTGWPHLLTPATVEHPWLGAVYQLAWWGDGQHFFANDTVDLFAPIVLYNRSLNHTAAAEAARFIPVNLAPGGPKEVAHRTRKAHAFRQSILYFLMMEPKAPPPADPRRALHFVAPGIGKIFARTDWSPRATYFDFGIGWLTVDHQHADGNNFEWYRKGEWLTKERTGYGDNVASSDAHNTVCIENAKPYHAKSDPNGYRAIYWRRGSQYTNGLGDADGKLLAHAENPHYVYALGDALGLFNSQYEQIGDVTEASRAIVWLVPDHVVVLDRAATKVDHRFKRFFLQLPAKATVSGQRTTMKSKGGQYLFVNTLLPQGAKITAGPAEKYPQDEQAEFDPTTAQLRVEPGKDTKSVRFLNVLEARDDDKPESPALVDAGADFIATAVHGVVVVFPRDLGAKIDTVRLTPPAGARTLMVTGLQPGQRYALKKDGQSIKVERGQGAAADSGGVLWQPLP